jgi:putative DNA primase/helicase
MSAPPKAKVATPGRKVATRKFKTARQIGDADLIGVYRFNADCVLINVRNGVVRANERGYTFEPHSPEHGFSQTLAVDFDADAGCPLFTETLEQCLPDPDDRLLLQFGAGNFLLPSNRYEVCLTSYGPGGTGKSTIADSISNVFEYGSDSLTNLSLRHLCDPKGYSLPRLQKSALNIGTELDSLEFEDSAIWKSLVSGEPIEVRPIYGAPFKMQTTAKLWFLANGLPRFKNGSDAELRRMRFLLFNQKPVAQNPNLKERLKAEAPGIFIWMLEGLCALLGRGSIPYGGENTMSVHDTFSVQNDPVGSFVKIHCRLSVHEHVEKNELLFRYGEFLADHGLPEVLGTSFFKNLKAKFPQLKDSRAWGGGNRIRQICGICVAEQ